jgi:hypothetical protein
MNYSARQVRELTSKSEWELVSASHQGAIGQLSEKALRSNIERTRRLRDKNRDLYRRQQIASRKRSGANPASHAPSNARTGQKAQIFDETLARFTKRLDAMKSSKGPKNPPARPAAKKSGQAALRQKARSPRMKAIQAHVGSRGRRKQARRDSR